MQLNQFSPKHQKISTSQLKKALQKIKQTQLQVLTALKNEAENSNINDSNPKITNQNVQANVSYIKSISHLNLLKMSEVSHMRKEFQKERQRLQEKIANLQHRNKTLQGELQRKLKLQKELNQENHELHERVKQLEIKSESIIKAEVLSYKDSMVEKIKDKIIIDDEIHKLKKQISQLLDENQIYKSQYEKMRRQSFQRQKNKFEKNMKMGQNLQKNKIPFEQMIGEIKRIKNNHDKIYQSLKSRARLSVTDLNVEQEIQKSIKLMLALVENSQKHIANEQKKIIQIDDSVIQDGKAYDSESFRDEVKRLDKQLFDHQHLKKQIYDLKAQILHLKEQKNTTQFQMLKLREDLSNCQRQLKVYQSKDNLNENNEYKGLIIELEAQMKNIRQQKNALANLVRKITENAFNSSRDEFSKSMQEQVSQVIEMNQRLKLQNQQYKITIQGNNIQIQKIRYESQKLQKEKLEFKVLIEKQIKSRLKCQSQIKDKNQIIYKLQQKNNQLCSTIQHNIKKSQAQIQFKLHETNALRQQNEKHLKELRSLREIAYNFQFVGGQNQLLKRKLMHVNSTVIHLWQIKQAQYGNIHSILAQFKQQ